MMTQKERERLNHYIKRTNALHRAAKAGLEALSIWPEKLGGFSPRQSKVRTAAKRKLRRAIALAEEKVK